MVRIDDDTMNVLDKITQAIKLLQEVDEYKNQLSSLQQEVDYKLSDLYHVIENDPLNAPQSCRIVKKIKELRQQRRKYLNDYELIKCYQNNIQKLTYYDNRKMLLAELNKTNNRLKQPYKNRVYTDEDMKELLGVK